MNTIETLTEVFALASGAVDLADKLIEVTKGKGRKVDGSSAKIGSSGDYAQIDSTGEKAVVSAIGFRAVAKAKVGSWYDFFADVASYYKYNLTIKKGRLFLIKRDTKIAVVQMPKQLELCF